MRQFSNRSSISIGALPNKEEFATMLKQFEDGEVDLEPTARETLRTHLVACCGRSWRLDRLHAQSTVSQRPDYGS